MEVATRKSEDMYGVIPASKLMGEAVTNRQDERLGKIHELVIDAKDGRLTYAVVAYGGFMGLGSKLLAMPWKAFEFSATDSKLIVDVDKKTFDNALTRTPRGQIAVTGPEALASTDTMARGLIGNSGMGEEGAC